MPASSLGKKNPAGGSGVRGGVKKEVTRDTVCALVNKKPEEVHSKC